jgi:folate-binding Fe-S cluster repair protein YgfZ
MSDCKVVLLSDRAVLRVTGEAARNFLQGLITNHIDKAKPGSAIHTGLLTPQGKIIVDFFVVPDGDGLLLELARTKLADLIRRLTVYKLRSQVAFAEEPSLRVAVSWGSTPPSSPTRGCLISGSASCFQPMPISANSAARSRARMSITRAALRTECLRAAATTLSATPSPMRRCSIS